MPSPAGRYRLLVDGSTRSRIERPQTRTDHHGRALSSGVAATISRLSDLYQVLLLPRLADLTVTSAYGAVSLHHEGVQNSKSSPAANALFRAAAAIAARVQAEGPPSVATGVPFTMTRA